MKTKVLKICCALLIVAALSGCVAVFGNRDSLRGNGTTLGQELIDLKKALDAGAITEKEYQEQKAGLLKEKK